MLELYGAPEAADLPALFMDLAGLHGSHRMSQARPCLLAAWKRWPGLLDW